MDQVVVAGIFAIIGAVIAGGFSLWAVCCQVRKSKEHALHVDLLERKREADREHREHKWQMQRLDAEKQRKPFLKVYFDRRNGNCIYPHSYTEPSPPSAVVTRDIQGTTSVDRTDWYVSLLVRNDGGSAAKRCQGQLMAIGRLEDGNYIDVPIHGPLNLKWAYDERDLELDRGMAKPLNIFVARDRSLPLEPQLQDGITKLVKDACSKMGTLVFKMVVTANEADPQEATLVVVWDGTFDGTWGAERIWLQ